MLEEMRDMRETCKRTRSRDDRNLPCLLLGRAVVTRKPQFLRPSECKPCPFQGCVSWHAYHCSDFNNTVPGKKQRSNDRGMDT